MTSSGSDAHRGEVESAGQLPGGLERHLDGSNLPARAGQAFRLTTVDADGWPRGAQLSAGEVLSVGPGALMLCLWSSTATAGNLRRNGRCTLTAVLEGAVHEVRLHAAPVRAPAAGETHAIFRARVESAEAHRAKYAEVTSGVTFRLDDPDAVLGRWHAQVEAMRLAADENP